MRFRCAVRLSACALILVLPLLAQSPNGVLNGLVVDPSSRAIVGAGVVAVNDVTGVQYITRTNGEGIYVLPNLAPGPYRLQVSKVGFKTLIKPDIILNVQDALSINFTLPIGALSETVTVEGGVSLVNSESATVSTVVDRQFAENLPMNGRSFQTLIQLTPGVVLTPSNNLDNGQFSVNGQRAASNYWMVDGVGANVGIGTNAQAAGNGLAGGNAAFSVLGGTNSLVSVDALQEFRIQTSTFAPEFGRTPGAQISIVTRSGTNQWHGSAFDYLRNDVLDANDWFSNYNQLPKPEERQNDFGGTLGGAIFKNRTFFFFSYEGLRLRLPQVAESTVPDMFARQHAIPAMQPYLNAFPLPSPNTPDDLTNEIAHFNAAFSNRAALDAYSLRIDHKLGGRLTLFGRYNYSPSSLVQRGANSTLNSLTSSQITLQTATAGTTWTPSSTIVNDVRLNYSRTDSKSHTSMDGFGGGAPISPLPFPSGFSDRNGFLLLGWLSLSPLGPEPGFQGHNLQRQINLVDNISIQKRSHTLKFGGDFRRLSPEYGNSAYDQEVLFGDVPSSLSGNILFAAVTAGRGSSFLFRNLGAFAQDTWRVNPAMTVTYGLRWELDVAPSSNPALLAVTGFNLGNLSSLALAPPGTPPFATTYGNIAPRIGIAYHLAGNSNSETVVRGGFGVFYDLATSEVGNTINPVLYPYGATNLLFSGVFPLDSTAAAPPQITAANLQSSGAGGVFDPHLELPYTLQWNVALEQALGAQQTLTASYVGSTGRRLLQTAQVNNPDSNFAAARLTANAGSSEYNALQLQFQRRLSAGLQALVSYAWSHSIDTGSAASAFGNQANTLLPGHVNENRGPSDFDIRNAFSAGLTYDITVHRANSFSNAVLHGWSIDSIVQARSASPVTVLVGNARTLNFYQVEVRPDVVAGQPLYLYGSQCASALQTLRELAPGHGCPGGKALNPRAFVTPPLDVNGNPSREGDLGRNALRTFGAWQWDFALHRDFAIHEPFRLQFRAEVFNLLNHPSFGPPVSLLSNTSQFGLSTQTLGQSLAGSNVGNGAFGSLYQIGGPRSMQFALKLIF